MDGLASPFDRRPRSKDGRIASVLMPASHRYVVLIPCAKRIRSASEIPAVFPELMICVTSAYGTLKVVMRIARFKLIVYPTLKNVARNPDAIPRRSAGTDPIIELMFGDAKNPRPAPKSIMNATREAYGVVASVVEKRKRERLITARPVVVKGTWPYLSERRPLRGPAASAAKPPQSIGAPRSSFPISRRRKWAHAVPKIPIGTLT